MDNKNFDLTKSISGYSNYSDAYEDFEEEIGTNNKNINTNNNLEILKNNIEHDENSIKKHSSILVNNDYLPIPENTNENSFKESHVVNKIECTSKNIERKIKKDNKKYNKNNIINITKEDHLNNFNNFNDSKELDEDLYSIKEYGSDFSYKDQDSNKGFIHIKLDKSDIAYKKFKSAFDTNLQPLDSKEIKNDNINNNLYLNLNVKKEDKNVNLEFKKYNSFANSKNELSNLNRNKKYTNNILSAKNSKKSNRYHPYFDTKNILKKAAVMNGKNRKKLKNSLKKSKNLLNDFNDINENCLENEYPINNIKFKDIKIDEINANYLKKHLRRIEINPKFKNSSNKYIKTLYELQNFYIDDSQIWVMKLNPNGKFLAVGCKNGIIKILEIIGYNYLNFKTNYDKKNILEYLNFINEVPYKTLERHKSDIIDLSWSPFYPNLLLSASFDHFVYLWDINQEGNNCLINEYEHSDIVTSVSFNPNIKNIFISGSIDTFVRVWKLNYNNIINDIEDNYKNDINNDNSLLNENSEANISENYKKTNKNLKIKNSNIRTKNKSEIDIANNTFDDVNKTNQYLDYSNNYQIDYFNIEHKITSLSYFPDGSKIAVGTNKGKIYVYNTFPKINYNNNFFVSKTTFGFFHGGKKVTFIQFIDKFHAIISTCDSYIRLADMITGRILYQYKGYVNKELMIRAYADLNDDVIIAGGEDGFCYIWNILDKNKKNKTNNENYVNFKPFAKEDINCSIIACEKSYTNYMKKILKLTNKLLISSIIINGTSKGRLEILLNIN